jgi:hypothetical protein
MEILDDYILSPSFIIPILYCSVLLNVILLLIIARIIGPLRKALIALYTIRYPILKGLPPDYHKDTKSQDNKGDQDKQPISRQELF